MLGGAFTEIDLTDKQCADLIMGTDELITDFLALDPDNIVFKQPGSDNYICADRNDIKQQMDDPANIVLPCIGTLVALSITPNLVCGLKMSKLQALGIAYGGYVALENMANVVANSTEQVFQIEDYDSPITVKALAGLRLFPEYAPEQVRVPFYPEEDENNDSYVRRLNEWGSQNNEPNIGDRWEDASQLLLGATHCQSGYEGQHMYRIVSASNPEYTVNPRLLQRMKDTGCIVADSLPPVQNNTPQIDWQSEYLYQDTADYTPARRLFDVSMEEEEKDVTELFRDMLVKQLNDIGDGLAEMISDDYNNRGQQSTLSFSGSTSNRQEIIQTFNQDNPNDLYEIGTNTYISVIAEPVNEKSRGLTYVTNLDGTFYDVLIGYPNIIVMVLDNEEKREKARSKLEFLDYEAQIRIDEIEDFVSSNNNELEVDVKPILIVVATVRPEELTQQTMNSRVITVVASDLYQALKLNQSEWETWYYDNVMKRVVNNNQTRSSDNITLYSLDFSNISNDSGNNIVLENSVYSPTASRIVAGDNYEVDIGYLQTITFQTSETNDTMEINGEQMSSASVTAVDSIIRNQLAGSYGFGEVLLHTIPGGPAESSQEVISLTSPLNISSSLQSINEAVSISNNDIGMTYVLGYVSEQSSSVTYITNLYGNLVKLEQGGNGLLYLDLSAPDKRESAISILEAISSKAFEAAEQLQQFSESSASDIDLVMDPLMVVVATKRPSTTDFGTTSRIFYVEADELLDTLMSPDLQSQEAWDNWFSQNILSRINNDNLAPVSGAPIIYDATIQNEVGRIEITFSNDAFTDIAPIEPTIAYLLKIQGFEDNLSNNSNITETDEMLSPIPSQMTTPAASPSMSPIPMNDLTLNTSGSATEPSTPDLSGGRKRRQTKSKRARKGKKTGQGKKKTRRRKNNRK